jgi:hypothetical protein
VPGLNNVKKYGVVGQATVYSLIRRMRIAHWLNKTTDTHLEYAIPPAFSLQKWRHERASVL